MIIWMIYSTLVGLIVVAAARAAEWLARLAGYRVRWIWAVALSLTVLLSAAAALRSAGSVALATPTSPIDLGEVRSVQFGMSWRHALSALRGSLDAPLRGVVVTIHRVVSPAANVSAALLSLAISLAVLLVLFGVGRRLRRARRGWPLVTMQGVDVRVAPSIGPVVIGFLRPDIVVPRWLLARRADEQRLVVTHEDEHVRARDPLLLGIAWGAVVVAPWNPAVWYMLSRLRLAVELDCDARVLRRGAAPRSYGSLLIDVAQHAVAIRLSALALADDSSHLHQRILAMKRGVPRFARLRGGFAAAFAIAGVLVACQATLPSNAEIERMDAAAATPAVRELAKTTRSEPLSNPSKAPFAGLIFIDGVRATESQLNALGRDRIESVDVLKGAHAVQQYGDEAANGVITIRTKRGGGTK